MVKALIVDDSAFARLSITKQLESDPEIDIVGYARDGVEAIEMTKKLKPGVITLDVEMPRMNGLEALSRIMAECPTPVVMLSSLTDKGSEATIRALELGATDFFLKAPSSTASGLYGLNENLNTKVKLAAAIDGARLRIKASEKTLPKSPAGPVTTSKKLSAKFDKVVVIGSSTGGPGALYQVIPNLPADIPAALLLVQHMPPVFTRSLANRLDELSAISVKEAEFGDTLMAGRALLAPGNFHMELKLNAMIGLNQKPPVMGLRPCVDITMLSASLAYGSAVVGVILTGMGADGTKGIASIKSAGGKVAAQDEASCVVYGMPRAAYESGNVDRVVPLKKMADAIVEMCRK